MSSASATPPPPFTPEKVIVLAGVCVLCMLASVCGLIWLCAYQRQRVVLSAEQRQDLSGGGGSIRYAQPRRGGGGTAATGRDGGGAVTLVSQPGGEYVLGSRTPVDKKMCGTHQHTTTIWVEA